MIRCQQAADISRFVYKKTQTSSTLTVLFYPILDVYGYCYYNDSFDASRTEIPNKPKPKFYHSQESLLMNILAKTRNQKPKYNAAPCAYFDGLFDYFNINEEAYHAKWQGMKWNGPCVLF